MKSLLRLGKSWPFNAALIVVVAALCGYYALGSAWDAFTASRSARQVEATETQARAAEGAARDAVSEAAAADVERRVEDAVRERTINPERERAEVALSHARARRLEAERNHEAHQNFRPVSLDDARLRERNCADLAELYPGQKFPGCR